MYSAFAAVGASTFQLIGRFAASDISVISDFSSSCQRPVPGMNSRVVPGRSRMARASARSSSRLAWREGTGSPFASLWVAAMEDEKPMPPSCTDWRSRATMRSSSSALASWPTARSPITTRRSAEWPTRKPAFTASRPSSRSR